MGSRKGLVYAVVERFDGLMAIGQSRRAAKIEVRQRDGTAWTVSTGKIHSYTTRDVYQRHVVSFAKWAREHHGTKQLEQRHFQPAHWPGQVNIAQAFGLRRAEMRDLRVGEIYQRHDGQLVAFVRNGKGGLDREAPILPGYEHAVKQIIAGRDPAEKVFSRVPGFMDVHGYRRGYAQNLYKQLSGRELPSVAGRLRPGSYDRSAALEVSHALGHRRLDVVLRHYLR